MIVVVIVNVVVITVAIVIAAAVVCIAVIVVSIIGVIISIIILLSSSVMLLFVYTSVSRRGKREQKKWGERSDPAILKAEKSKDQGRAREGKSAQIWPV